MPSKQHIVRLSLAERATLQQLIARGSSPARMLARARILLKADAGARGPRFTDCAVANAVEVSPRTVARVRATYAAHGLEAALQRRPRSSNTPRKLDSALEAQLIAIACSTPPDGRAHWTLRLLANRMVELELVSSIAPETVRKTLKQTFSNPGGPNGG